MYSLSYHIIVARVARVVPVLHHTTPRCSCLPPVVWLWEETRLVPRQVTSIVGHHIVGSGASSASDGVCEL